MSAKKPNKTIKLNPPADDLEWVKQDTAILVVHGIGNQLPLETLDQFGRGLIAQYKAAFDDEFYITHEIVPKSDSTDKVWFDNVLRLHKSGSVNFIDLYEYYWANYSQDKATWSDLNRWLQGIVKGASKFYKRNALIGEQYKDKSPFFDSRTGKFKPFVYWFFLAVVGRSFLIADVFWRLIIWLISLIPLAGKIADSLLESYVNSGLHDLCNVVSEVAIYNVFDPKSRFYEVKRAISDGAISALTYLIERTKEVDPKNPDSYSDYNIAAATKKTQDNKLHQKKPRVDEIEAEFKKELEQYELYYPAVIVAGHSLGSQVTYDAINKLNLLISMDKVNTFDSNGICKLKHKTSIAEQLRGYITFGCPLDKIVFFLRENVPDNEYLRQQFLDNYHEFKQRDLDLDNKELRNKKYLHASCGLKRLLDDIQWHNYFDGKDYVSGGLDYYTGLINIDCHFKAGTFGFTHSYYWDCNPFYKDIVLNFLM